MTQPVPAVQRVAFGGSRPKLSLSDEWTPPARPTVITAETGCVTFHAATSLRVNFPRASPGYFTTRSRMKRGPAPAGMLARTVCTVPLLPRICSVTA